MGLEIVECLYRSESTDYRVIVRYTDDKDDTKSCEHVIFVKSKDELSDDDLKKAVNQGLDSLVNSTHKTSLSIREWMARNCKGTCPKPKAIESVVGELKV